MAQQGVNKVIELYLSGKSIPQVADSVRLSRSTVRYHLKKAGALRGRAEGVRLAAKEGRAGGKKGVRRVFTEKWKANLRKSLQRHHEQNAKGTSLKPSGYLEITRGEHKGRGQHCVIAEKLIRRPLRPDECVHHIDGDRANNAPENLQVMTRSEHAALHARECSKHRSRDSAGRYL